MEPEGLISCSPERSTGPYPEPYQSNTLHAIPSYLSKIHINIVLPPTSRSSQWSLFFWLSHQYLYAFLFSQIRATFPAHLIEKYP
jgi:hypothetical protein